MSRKTIALIFLTALFASKAYAAVRVPPFFWYEKEGEFTFRMALLLYWSGQDPKSSFTLLAPLYYNATAPGEDLRVLLPLHFRYRAGGGSSTLWGPYFEKKTPDALTRFAVPIFWVYKDSEVSQGLIPPYFWRKKADRAFEVGFPLYWRYFRKEGEELKDIQVAVPWFRIRSQTGSLRSFFPLYWGRTKILDADESSGAAKSSSWNLFFPLLFNAKLPDGSEKTVTPLYSRIRRPDGRVFGHQFLIFYLREPWGAKTDGFIPFFIHQEDAQYSKLRFLFYYLSRDISGGHLNTSLFPLFKYKRDGDRTQFLTPLVYLDRDADKSRGYVANFFWSRDNEGNTKTVFFPLAWRFRSQDSLTTVFPPLAAFHKDEESQISMVAPFYFRRQKGEDVLKIIPPFMSRVTPERTWKGLFFLYWRTSRPDRSAVTLLPLFRYSRFPGGQSIYLPALYHLREGQETQGVAGIYLWDHRGKTQYNILPPLYWDFRRPAWKVKTFFPVYKFQNEEIREKGFFPLIAGTDDVRKSSDAPKHFLAGSSRFLPFYFYRKLEPGHDLWLPVVLGRFEKEQNSKKEEVTRGRLFLLAYWERTPEAFTSRLDPLYSYYRTPDAKGFTAPTAPFPLWRYEATDRRDEKKKVVQGAFFPYYWKESLTLRRDLVLPLFYKSRQKSEDGLKETSRKTWLLLYYDSVNSEEDKSAKVFAPLYWNFRDKNRQTTLVPPYWKERDGKTSRDVFFPLYWSLKSSERTFSYFFPLYFHHRRESAEAKVVFPVFWNFKTAQSDVRVIPPYFSVKSAASRTLTTGFAPLWTTVRSTENPAMNFQFLGGLAGFERDAEGRGAVTILYFLKI